MSSKSSSSDLAWVPAPTEITADQIAAATRYALANARNPAEATEFLDYLFGEVSAA